MNHDKNHNNLNYYMYHSDIHLNILQILLEYIPLHNIHIDFDQILYNFYNIDSINSNYYHLHSLSSHQDILKGINLYLEIYQKKFRQIINRN
jgi:hypothetical protein